MESIIDIDHRHAKRIFKKFTNKNIDDYHDLQVQTDALLFADVFENFRNKCIEIYHLVPAHVLSAPGLVWEACLKKAEIELELLTDTDMLLIVEKGIRGRICHEMYRYAKSNNKYMKEYNKDKESSNLMYLDANNLYGRVMSQNLPQVLNGKKYFQIR